MIALEDTFRSILYGHRHQPSVFELSISLPGFLQLWVVRLRPLSRTAAVNQITSHVLYKAATIANQPDHFKGKMVTFVEL